VLGHVRASQAVVRGEIESAGFELVTDLRDEVELKENYFMIFRKKKAGILARLLRC